jgi:hypothetical protein
MSERPGGDRECPAFDRRRRIYADMLATAPAPPVDGWQPIETHDGDSLPVVVGRANERNRFYYPLSAFLDVTGVWRVLCSPGGNTPVPYEPTHFQPLPQPPNNERTG